MAADYLKTYFKVLISILLIVGLINFTVDPLWYGQGNRLMGANPPWNERISKTNLFLHQNPETFDCLIFGTSRTTLLSTASFQNHHCFNYSFSGGKVEEFVTYANYAKQKGVSPEIVYVEIEPESLNWKRKPRSFEEVSDPMPAYQAYFLSFNTLWLSIKTLTQQYSFSRLYDRTFQGKLAEDVPQYEPELEDAEGRKECDLSRIRFYEALKQVFPEASWVGFVAPVSAWYVFNNSYSPRLLECQLQGIYQLSVLFDAVHDFAVPSALTVRDDNTYDGNHYYPEVFDQVASVLENRRSNPGVSVNQYSLPEYQRLYASALKQFLVRIGESDQWQG